MTFKIGNFGLLETSKEYFALCLGRTGKCEQEKVSLDKEGSTQNQWEDIKNKIANSILICKKKEYLWSKFARQDLIIFSIQPRKKEILLPK